MQVELVKNLFTVILFVVSVFYIAFLDHFEKDSLGLLEVLFIDFFILFLAVLFSKKKPGFCKYIFIILLATNILLLFNTSDWNEGAMGGSYYYVPLLKYATDILYALILFSAFLLLIPIIIYLFFLYSLSKLFCKKDKKS